MKDTEGIVYRRVCLFVRSYLRQRGTMLGRGGGGRVVCQFDNVQVCVGVCGTERQSETCLLPCHYYGTHCALPRSCVCILLKTEIHMAS